jgi:hypothetical protein
MSSISAGGLGDFTPARRKPGQASHHLNGRGSKLASAATEPDDRIIGEWSRKRLLKMDQKFCSAVARAIARGLERRPLKSQEGSMTDRQFAISGKWALAADRLQWMVQRRHMSKGQVKWQSVSFVASTRDVLARCLPEKGCPPADAERLLAGLPATFKEWAKMRAVSVAETVSAAE